MQDKNLPLTKLYTGKRSVETLGGIHQLIKSQKYETVILNLAGYEYIHPCFAALIASSIYLGKSFGTKVKLRYDRDNKKCMEFLRNSGIYSHFDGKNTNELSSTNNSIPFEKYSELEEAFETVETILQSLPVLLSDDLHNSFFSRIGEIFDNAFTHGKSDIGIFSCGFLNKSKTFSFSVYDAGIGVCKNVNNYLGENFECAKALEWAFQSGNSTLNGKLGYTRGAGLNLLESFVKANNGRIDLISDGGYCNVTSKERKFHNLSNPIIGTVFSMSIKTDSNHIYKFAK